MMSKPPPPALTVLVNVALIPTEGAMAVATSAVVAVAPVDGFTTVAVAIAPVETVATLKMAPRCLSEREKVAYHPSRATSNHGDGIHATRHDYRDRVAADADGPIGAVDTRKGEV